MKKLLLLIVTFLSVSPVPVIADQYVRGYTRKDGTYVQPHYRSGPNSSLYDNYSSRGNTNPYTGERGSQRNEFSLPPSNYRPRSLTKPYWSKEKE